MRRGLNPQKEAVLASDQFTHLVVIPVYIPNLDGYYAESFKILKNCILSLQKTVHTKTFISIVNNGSCNEVVGFLNEIYDSRIINELLHTENIGKLNAVLKGIAGHKIPLITIADADILFKSNWQHETLLVFNGFPKAAVVGLIPQFKMFSTYSYNLIFDRFWNDDLRFTKTKEPEEMKRFYKSINWDDDYNQDYLKQQLTVSSKKCTAIVGSGHAVATYRAEIFSKLIQSPSKYKLGGDSESTILDTSVLKLDGWRLTTIKNLAYHMGNIWEDWMMKEIDCLDEIDQLDVQNLEPVQLNKRYLVHFLKSRFFKKIMKFKPVYRFFLKYKKLPSAMVKTY